MKENYEFSNQEKDYYKFFDLYLNSYFHISFYSFNFAKFSVEFLDISESNINDNWVYLKTFLQNIIQELKCIDPNMIIDFYLGGEENNFINRVKKLILKV
jgi:hypothetical protein